MPRETLYNKKEAYSERHRLRTSAGLSTATRTFLVANLCLYFVTIVFAEGASPFSATSLQMLPILVTPLFAWASRESTDSPVNAPAEFEVPANLEHDLLVQLIVSQFGLSRAETEELQSSSPEDLDTVIRLGDIFQNAELKSKKLESEGRYLDAAQVMQQEFSQASRLFTSPPSVPLLAIASTRLMLDFYIQTARQLLLTDDISSAIKARKFVETAEQVANNFGILNLLQQEQTYLHIVEVINEVMGRIYGIVLHSNASSGHSLITDDSSIILYQDNIFDKAPANKARLRFEIITSDLEKVIDQFLESSYSKALISLKEYVNAHYSSGNYPNFVYIAKKIELAMVKQDYLVVLAEIARLINYREDFAQDKTLEQKINDICYPVAQRVISMFATASFNTGIGVRPYGLPTILQDVDFISKLPTNFKIRFLELRTNIRDDRDLVRYGERLAVAESLEILHQLSAAIDIVKKTANFIVAKKNISTSEQTILNVALIKWMSYCINEPSLLVNFIEWMNFHDLHKSLVNIRSTNTELEKLFFAIREKAYLEFERYMQSGINQHEKITFEVVNGWEPALEKSLRFTTTLSELGPFFQARYDKGRTEKAKLQMQVEQHSKKNILATVYGIYQRNLYYIAALLFFVFILHQLGKRILQRRWGKQDSVRNNIADLIRAFFPEILSYKLDISSEVDADGSMLATISELKVGSLPLSEKQSKELCQVIKSKSNALASQYVAKQPNAPGNTCSLEHDQEPFPVVFDKKKNQIQLSICVGCACNPKLENMKEKVHKMAEEMLNRIMGFHIIENSTEFLKLNQVKLTMLNCWKDIKKLEKQIKLSDSSDLRERISEQKRSLCDLLQCYFFIIEKIRQSNASQDGDQRKVTAMCLVMDRLHVEDLDWIKHEMLAADVKQRSYPAISDSDFMPELENLNKALAQVKASCDDIDKLLEERIDKLNQVQRRQEEEQKQRKAEQASSKKQQHEKEQKRIAEEKARSDRKAQQEQKRQAEIAEKLRQFEVLEQAKQQLLSSIIPMQTDVLVFLTEAESELERFKILLNGLNDSETVKHIDVVNRPIIDNFNRLVNELSAEIEKIRQIVWGVDLNYLSLGDLKKLEVDLKECSFITRYYRLTTETFEQTSVLAIKCQTILEQAKRSEQKATKAEIAVKAKSDRVVAKSDLPVQVMFFSDSTKPIKFAVATTTATCTTPSYDSNDSKRRGRKSKQTTSKLPFDVSSNTALLKWMQMYRTFIETTETNYIRVQTCSSDKPDTIINRAHVKSMQFYLLRFLEITIEHIRRNMPKLSDYKNITELRHKVAHSDCGYAQLKTLITEVFPQKTTVYDQQFCVIFNKAIGNSKISKAIVRCEQESTLTLLKKMREKLSDLCEFKRAYTLGSLYDKTMLDAIVASMFTINAIRNTFALYPQQHVGVWEQIRGNAFLNSCVVPTTRNVVAHEVLPEESMQRYFDELEVILSKPSDHTGKVTYLQRISSMKIKEIMEACNLMSSIITDYEDTSVHSATTTTTAFTTTASTATR